MKLCEKCGAVNSDSKTFCVDCSERLGDPVCDAEADRLEQSLDNKLEKLYNDDDPLYVSRFDKIVGSISLVGLAADIVFLIIAAVTRRETALLWLGAVFFVLSAVEAFLPQLNWAIEKMRLSFIIGNPDDAVPGAFYKFSRKAAILIAAVTGIIMISLSAANFRHPPVIKYISDIANNKSAALSSNTTDYINASPEKWEKIIGGGNYTVSVFLGELENAGITGLEENLMMVAIAEITGKDDLSFAGKDAFLFSYYTNGWE